MTLAERLAEYVRACFPGLYVVSHEHDDAVAEIAALCRARAGRWPPGTSNAASPRPARPTTRRPSPAPPTRWPPSAR